MKATQNVGQNELNNPVCESCNPTNIVGSWPKIYMDSLVHSYEVFRRDIG